jgi:8-oxo-dGTP pyrophosphatase MutT (NUDIX family)
MTIEQAGAIAVKGLGTRAEVLVVRAKRNPSHWIFPKGHIERGETAADAAVRELREEAGVVGSVLRAVGKLSFQMDRNTISVEYFLVRFLGTAPPAEERETRWTSLQDARTLLTYPELRGQLDIAERLIAAATRPSSW